MVKPKNFYLMICILICASFSSFGCRFEYKNDVNTSNLILIQEKTLSLNAGKNLGLKTDAGDIKITTWDKDEVLVKIYGNKRAKDHMQFKINGTDDMIEVLGEKESSFLQNFNNVNVKFEIYMPKKLNVKLFTRGGDIKIEDLTGSILCKTSGGDLNLSKINGDVNLSTSGGDIQLSDIKAPVKASTSGGDVNISRFEGNLDVSTSGGDISLDGKNSSINAITSGGDIKLKYDGSNKGINMTTSGGSIQAFLPNNFGATADLSTSGGSISVDFTINNVKKISSSKFEADLNNGGAPLSLHTSGGNIDVKKQ